MNFSAPPRRAVDSSAPPIGKKPRMFGGAGGGSAASPSWSKQPVAVAAPAPVKSIDDEYPVLGACSAKAGAGSSGSTTTQTSSYAKLAANWAKSEEERKIAEANEMRARIERQRREDYEIAERRRIYNSIHAHRQHQEYTTHEEYTDEYVDEGFDDDGYTKTDLRAERRSAARYEGYDDCDYEDNDGSGEEEY